MAPNSTPFTIARRVLMLGLAAATVPLRAAATPDFAPLEKRSGGRLGVCILDSATGARLAYRGDERFPMCSTFKLLAAAATLARVDAGREALDRQVAITRADFVAANSPLTAPHLGGWMPVAALCEAALIVSDNTAANLLVAALGGPADVTAWLRSISDAVTRLDRVEPAVNACIPGDPRDTTSSNAMVETLARLVLGSVLTPASREMLTGWMIGNRTGAARIRAGLPSGWRVGDKTGTSENGVNGTSNDIAVIWPAGRAPLLVVTYLTQSPLGGDARNAVLADVGRIAAGA